jgi:hypothetical protein
MCSVSLRLAHPEELAGCLETLDLIILQLPEVSPGNALAVRGDVENSITESRTRAVQKV